MGIKDLVTSYPALQEFGVLARAIQPIMSDPQVDRKEKRKILNDLTQQLSEKSFNNGQVAKQILIIVNMKEDECKKFSSAEAQVGNILSWLPRMEIHKQLLTDTVKKARKSCGVKG